MQRFSVSVDDDLAEWIEATADERGVSKAKVIRDAIETASVTGFVSRDEPRVEGSALLDRVADLEARVTALEGPPYSRLDQDEVAGGDLDAQSGIVALFAAQLEDRPPRTHHGQEAVIRVFRLLLTDGPMQTSDLREAVYPAVEDEFTDAETMWQSIRRYFEELPGIESVGHGQWDAAPEHVLESVR